MKILTLPPLIIKKTTDRRTMQNDIGDRNNQKQNLCPISSQSYAIKPRCRLVMSPRMFLSLCGFLYNFFFIKKILSWFILCLLRPLLDGGNRYLLSLSLRFRLTRGIYLWRKEKGITSFDLSPPKMHNYVSFEEWFPFDPSFVRRDSCALAMALGMSFAFWRVLWTSITGERKDKKCKHN